MLLVNSLWELLSSQPLIWLVVTLTAYLLALKINLIAKKSPLMHPVLLALSFIILILMLTDTSYPVYLDGARFIHFLMGPAVVALAIPLYDNFSRVRSMLIPLLVACVTGAVVASLSAVLMGIWFGLDGATLYSLAPKSVTSPIAIGIADKLGGFGSLAAGLVLLTGAMGCLLAAPLYNWMKIKDPAVKGFVLGVSAHAMGTAQAFEYGALAGAFGGLAMGMTGTFTAFVLPVLLPLLGIGR